MSCHVMSCHVMSCHVMSCHVMSCHVMSCHALRLLFLFFLYWHVGYVESASAAKTSEQKTDSPKEADATTWCLAQLSCFEVWTAFGSWATALSAIYLIAQAFGMKRYFACHHFHTIFIIFLVDCESAWTHLELGFLGASRIWLQVYLLELRQHVSLET